METTIIAATAIICGTIATTAAILMGHDNVILAGLLSFISSIASGAIAYQLGRKKSPQ